MASQNDPPFVGAHVLVWDPVQFINTNFMGLEPGQLFCEYEGCTNTNYNTNFFEGNTKDNVNSYSTIFSRIDEYYGKNISELAAAMSISAQSTFLT